MGYDSRTELDERAKADVLRLALALLLKRLPLEERAAFFDALDTDLRAWESLVLNTPNSQEEVEALRCQAVRLRLMAER
jgi:hypothetical protein